MKVVKNSLGNNINKKNKMAYKMKGFGGFGNSPAKQTKFPDSPKSKKVKNAQRLAKMDAEYAKGLPARISVDNPEHKGGGDAAWEAMQNDHDVDDKGVPQTGAKEYYIKTGTKPKK